jgi:hypothetical protein
MKKTGQVITKIGGKSQYENIPDDFDAKAYIELNDDLKHMTEIEANTHYENYGYKENRKYKYKNITYDFNTTKYIELNLDLKQISEIEAKSLYENIPDDFNVKVYIQLNEDLIHMTEIEANNHYEEYGYKEDRKYKYENIPVDFNSTKYIELNKDLSHMTEIQAKSHYENYGCKENRTYKYEKIPDDFNAKVYIELNDDLKHITYTEAKSHYENYGRKENRKYKYENIPDDFNATEYIELNSDLNHITEIEAKSHYENCGRKENRNYKYCKFYDIYEESIPDDFNPTEYTELNYDLRHMTEIEAKFHYGNYGHKEGRQYSKNITYTEENIDSLMSIQNTLIHKPVEIIENIDDYDELILIVDYNLLKGGTNQFIDSIVYKYKQTSNLLIVKNVENSISFSINNEYFIKPMDEDDSLKFLHYYSNKIIKIFINSIIGHTTTFINSLFNLNKSVTCITHDYNLLLNIAQPYSFQINAENKNTHFDINKCDSIVSQNINTLKNFMPFLDSKINRIISPLPDYRHAETKIITNNTKIVVGILGRISVIKGLYIIKKIINKYKNEFDFIIFGESPLKNENVQTVEYSDINHLNTLLTIHKPNVLLETSIWPETYSYTLSLAKIIDLPILTLKKDFKSTVENRLNDYSKTYTFNTLVGLHELIIKHKQDYFYTIKPEMYFPKFWDEYFIYLKIPKKSQSISIKKNIVLITSKIKKTDKPLTYSKVRCVYTSEEVYYQTINTINSIRKYLPNPYIILFDNSKLEINQKTELESMTDLFINITDDESLNYYTDSKYKSMGELSQMCSFYLNYLINVDDTSVLHFFKISGRYLINKYFNYNNFNNKYNVFKRNEMLKNINYYYTSFYKLNNEGIHKFFTGLIQLFNNKHLYFNKHYEDFVPEIIEKINIPELGITQIFAPFKLIDNI